MKKKILGELILASMVIAEFVFFAIKYGILEMLRALAFGGVASSIIGFAVWCILTGGIEETLGDDEEE